MRVPYLAIVVWCLAMPAGAQDAPATDAAVATEIERRFSDDRAINAQTVEIQVRDGVVVLTGRVPSEDAKAHAAKIASAVDGVEEVDNRLTPGPGGQPVGGDPRAIPERMPGHE